MLTDNLWLVNRNCLDHSATKNEIAETLNIRKAAGKITREDSHKMLF